MMLVRRRPPIAARVRVASIAAAALVWGAPARAEDSSQPAPEPIVLRYDAPAGCPTADDFFSAIRARTSRVRRAAPGEAARLLRISLERTAERASGRIVVEEATTASAPRIVTAPTCAQVAQALSLVAALSIDPSLRAEPTTRGEGSNDPPPARIEAPETPPSTAPHTEETTPPADIGGPPHDAPAPATVTTTPTRAPSTRWGAGVQIDVDGLAAPGARIGPRVFLDLLAAEDPNAPRLSWALAGRLSASLVRSSDITIDGATAAFAWSTLRLDGCPLAVRLAPRATLRPCASVEAGTLHAEGTAAVHGQSRLRPWGGAGLFLRTDWRPVGPLILTAEAGALAPLLREDFFFSPENLPNSIVYKAPAVTARAGIGVGVRFP